MLPTPGIKRRKVPSSDHSTLFWNGNQVIFPSETDLSFLVWRKQGQYWLLDSLFYVPPYLLHSPLSTIQYAALHLSISVSWLIVLGGRDSNVPSAYGKFRIAEMHPELSSLEPKVLKLQSQREKPWSALPTVPGAFRHQHWKAHIPTNPSTVSKLGWLVTLVWTYFCTVTVTSYLLPFIFHKYI